MTRRVAGLFLTVLIFSATVYGASPDQTPLDLPAFYPEGPTVSRGNLLWAEMSADRIRKYDGSETVTVWQRQGCGPTAVKFDGHGGFWVLCHLNHRVLHLDNNFTILGEITHARNGREIVWPNDATVDDNGRLYVTSAGIFDLDAAATGAVYFIDRKHQAVEVLKGLRYANGIFLDRKRQQLYVSEHLNRRIHRYSLLAPGKVGSHEVFFDFRDAPSSLFSYPLAGPDGLMVRENGAVLVAEYGAGRILEISRERRFVRQLNVPMQFVTNMTLWPNAGTLIVTGTFHNDIPPQHGRVISLRLD